MKQARMWTVAALMLLPSLLHAQAAAEAGQIRFSPAPGVQLHARLQEDGSIEVQLQPAGTRQQLPGVEDGNGQPRLEALDVDFDGRPELLVRDSVGMVNEAVVVYRYDSGRRELQPLQPVSSAQASCDPLMMLSLDQQTRTVRSACRSGPIWYVDQYRYDGPQLYLYRTQRMLMGDFTGSHVLRVDPIEDEGPLAVWLTLDPRGARLQTVIGPALAEDAPERGTGATVQAARLPLHTLPGDATTRRYLVDGDRVELLDERDGWLQVRYRNPSRGPIEGWVYPDGP